MAHYGSISQFGYKDFIPLFTGEAFDPDAWADLVVLSGARYAGPVSEHADNYSLWDSFCLLYTSSYRHKGTPLCSHLPSDDARPVSSNSPIRVLPSPESAYQLHEMFFLLRRKIVWRLLVYIKVQPIGK